MMPRTSELLLTSAHFQESVYAQDSCVKLQNAAKSSHVNCNKFRILHTFIYSMKVKVKLFFCLLIKHLVIMA
jgi:hypothetical protein